MFYQSQKFVKTVRRPVFLTLPVRPSRACSWSLHEHARETLMSTCAHERFMSMLMKPSRARGREAFTGKTTFMLILVQTGRTAC